MNIDGNEITQEQLDMIVGNSPGEINLIGADLSGANLIGAKLGRADLYRANLIGAKLGRAILHGADLSGADLRGADLPDGTMWNDNTDMSVFTGEPRE